MRPVLLSTSSHSVIYIARRSKFMAEAMEYAWRQQMAEANRPKIIIAP